MHKTSQTTAQNTSLKSAVPREVVLKEVALKEVALKEAALKTDAKIDQNNRFSEEDVRQILALAMQQTEFSNREQIEDIAQELSIEKGEIAYAIETWQSQKLKAKKQQQRRQQFYKYELVPYLVVNAFLVWLNLSISGTLSWVIYPLMGWGTAVLISFLSGASTGCFYKLSAER